VASTETVLVISKSNYTTGGGSLQRLVRSPWIQYVVIVLSTSAVSGAFSSRSHLPARLTTVNRVQLASEPVWTRTLVGRTTFSLYKGWREYFEATALISSMSVADNRLRYWPTIATGCGGCGFAQASNKKPSKTDALLMDLTRTSSATADENAVCCEFQY
jgi:hypothetical protein